MSRTIHYYPDALVVFVKGFREIEKISREDLLIAQTKEISSLSINMTIANNPSSFSLTLVDVANKFLVPDKPASEISTLNANSKFQVRRDAEVRNFKPVKKGGFQYYEFDGYQSGDRPWFSFEYGSIEDQSTGYRAPIFYRRLPSGTITERWAFDEEGHTIKITEAQWSNPTNTIVFLSVLGANGRVSGTKPFMLTKVANSDFIQKYQNGVSNPLQQGRCKIEPMDRIAIFLSKRYTQSTSGTYVLNESPQTELIRTFTGLVNTVQVGYTEQGNTITINGEDVTKWLKLSVIPVNPAALQDQTSDYLKYSANNSADLNFYTNLFKGLSAPDVVKIMCLGTEGLEADSRSKIEGTNRVNIRGVGVYTAASKLQNNPDTIAYNPKTGTFQIQTQGSSKSRKVSTIDIKGMMGTLFTKSSLHVVDPTQSGLDVYLAYPEQFKTVSLFQSDYLTRRDICYKAAQDSNFLFYADRNGHIWFHPPRYSNAWILTSKNDKVFIIDEDSIISSSMVEDDTNVYSTCIVSSEADYRKGVVEGAEFYNRGSYTDELIAFKYGVRIISVSNPFIAKLGGSSVGFASEPAIFYGKVWLQRLLANKNQGQATISGRAEIEAGFPVYFPARNMIYFVETVDHQIDFGGTFTTTIHLSYGHKPWENISEIITQSVDQISALDGHINIEFGTRDSQPTTDSSGLRKLKPIDSSPLIPDSVTIPNVQPLQNIPKP